MRSLNKTLFIGGEILAVLLCTLSLNALGEGLSKGKELAAIHTQEQSIQKLRKFLKEHPGDSREPDFLIRLADLYFEKSGISFQYTEGESVMTAKKLYTDSLIQAADVLSLMLTKYPSHVSVADAYFKRGKANKELKHITQSRSDYLKILAIAPTYYRLDSALMDLADYAQDENHHTEALSYLLQIETNESSQYYTMAIHKAAWSYFNMNDFSHAIQYLKKEIITDQTKKSELPYLESAYQDLALFYFEAINKKAGFANVIDAVALFQELSHDQVDSKNRPFFGLVLTRFSKLLKAYQMTAQLHELKSILIEKYKNLPETMEIAMLIFEYHFDRHEYTKLTELLGDVEFTPKYEQTISQSLNQLHQLVMKNKKSTELDQLLLPLVDLTEFLKNHLTTKNSTTVLAVYALAETSFSIERFATATHYYSLLLNPEVLLPPSLSRNTLLIHLVSSRYQELKSMHLILEPLKIVMNSAPVIELKKNEQIAIQEWFGWVFDPQTVQNLDSISFQLEAYKMKYGYFDRKMAVSDLEQFALQNSSLEEARVAAAIALDTGAVSLEWKNVFEFTQKILLKKNWKDQKFTEKVQEMAADSHLKITLASTDAQEILTRAKECIHQFKDFKILLQCKLIQAKTWIALKQYTEAERVLSELRPVSLKNDDLKTVTLMKADVHQKQGKLGLAAQEMEQFLELTQFKDAEMAQHSIQIYWFQRNYKKIQSLLSNPALCNGLTDQICEQYLAAMNIDQSLSASSYHRAFKQTVKASKNAIALWAIIALNQPQKLPFQDRIVLLQRLSSHWENVDPFLQVQFLNLMRTRVTDAVESIRKSVSSIAPLSSEPSSIEKRIRLLQDIDQTFAKVMKLNWLEIKIKTVSELQLVYQQLTADLKTIGTPDNLIQPFVKKQNQLSEAAQQLFSLAVHFKMGSAQNTLLTAEVKEKIPTPYWDEWQNGVKQQKPDYLYYLISLRSQDEFSPLLRGLVLTTLLRDSAATEGYELIKAAPESPWKGSILNQFEVKGTALGVAL